ncbi:MAG: ComF family protein [Candidatus Omnitrophota bacterium]
MIRSLVIGLKDLVYPPICTICRERIPSAHPFKGLCLPCNARIVMNAPPSCVKCFRPLSTSHPGVYCRNCTRQTIHFDFAYCSSPFTPFLRQLLHLYKFHQKTYLRHTFADHMIRFIRQYNLDMDQFDLFVPMPLSGVRLRERGYNQAGLIAQLLAKHFNKPCPEDILLKARHTASQSSLAKKERFTNVTGAFKINSSAKIINTNILIIDDLMTTGATASAAALAVKSAKAKKVAILTLAIA